MSALLTEPEPETNAPVVRPRSTPVADAPGSPTTELQDRLPVWFRTSPRTTLAVAIVAMLFLWFARQPLWHTDLWGHLAYGRLIWQSQALPETEPFMPLAEGMPLVDTAWLSQVVGYGVHALGGVTGLQFLYAAAVTFCVSLLLWRFVRKTDSLAVGLLGVAAFLWVEWQALKIIRPQLAGLWCFIALLTLMTSRRRPKADWILVPAVMALWANLHGSFPVGLALLGALCVGRAIDVFLWTRRLASRERQQPESSGDSRPPARLAVWRDARFRRLLFLTELAAVAVLINPYGFQLYAEVFTLSANANLADLQEWSPLTLRMKQGQAAFAVALLLVVLFRFAPRRITAGEALLLVGFGAASLWSSRFLVWWAPLAAMSLVLHGHAVLSRKADGGRRNTESRSQSAIRNSQSAIQWAGINPEPRSLWTIASIGLCWIAFALTPFGLRTLHGVEPKLENAVSAETPIGAAEFLRTHPPRGLVFNPYEWGDYFVWAGQPNVFVTSHAHLVPRQVWQHYILILTAADGWDDLLARYGADTVVINRYDAGQRELLARLRGSGNWRVIYQDDRSVIFKRAT